MHALVLVVFTVYIIPPKPSAPPSSPRSPSRSPSSAPSPSCWPSGFSINQLTLFGLVLVIGIVVDDAIVVVENTWSAMDRRKERNVDRKRRILSMQEVSGPVIATTLVLLAVFVPTIFIPGITGTLFKQFAVTISIATVFQFRKRPDPQPRAVRHPAQAAEGATRSLSLVQCDPGEVHDGLPGHDEVCHPAFAGRRHAVHWPDRVVHLRARKAADGLRAAGG